MKADRENSLFDPNQIALTRLPQLSRAARSGELRKSAQCPFHQDKAQDKATEETGDEGGQQQ